MEPGSAPSLLPAGTCPAQVTLTGAGAGQHYPEPFPSFPAAATPLISAHLSGRGPWHVTPDQILLIPPSPEYFIAIN